MHFAITLLFGEGGTGACFVFPCWGKGSDHPNTASLPVGERGSQPHQQQVCTCWEEWGEGEGAGRGLVLFFCRKVLKKSDAATAVQQCKISLCISTKLNYGGANSFKIQHTCVDECLGLSMSWVTALLDSTWEDMPLNVLHDVSMP